MSFARPISTKPAHSSTLIAPLPALPKPPSRLQSKRTSILPNPIKKETHTHLSSTANENELQEIVSNLTTIVKRSEELLTPIKHPQVSATVRRTASLHLTKTELDRQKFSNVSQSKLHDSISDRSSECGASISSIPRRTSIRSMHNAEKYSGIKCALPSFKATVPSTFKGLEKHCTPTKINQSISSTSLFENEVTPANTSKREKSPWRMRFEKFLKHEQMTPLSPAIESVDSTKTKSSIVGKENRTPSFRLPARRSSRFNLPT